MATDPKFLVLTDLLLGAVYADERLAGEEVAAVRRLLREVIGGDELPEEVDIRIDEFDAAAFDLSACAAAFSAEPAVKRAKLLELVAGVFDADEEVDFAEDDYMRDLARALGISDAEVSKFALDYTVEDAHAIAEIVVSVPPPVPKH
jgi:uncharacterized tellurite resistance protein B-like protein